MPRARGGWGNAMTPKVDHQLLAEFLVAAKQHTYAAQGDDHGASPMLPGTRQFEYGEGPFRYRDISAGLGFFSGLEMVYHTEQPIWTMSYAGGVWPTNVLTEEIPTIYTFLGEALRLVEAVQPFRGPSTYQQSEYLYWNES